MPSVFLCSDHHFGHAGMCRFLKADGSKLRPWDHPDEMDEVMIKRHNECVKPTDKCYFMGDVVINRKALKTLLRLNGDKVLIKGNHDIFKLNDYLPYFRDIRAYHVMNGLILSHIPIHVESLSRFGCNVHGHLHANRIMRDNGYGGVEIDPRYFNASVECIDYRPILFEDMLKRIVAEGGTVGFKPSPYAT